MKRLILIYIAYLISASLSDLKADDFFRIWLKDKENSPYALERPQEFLTQASLNRRLKQGYELNVDDLPLSPAYISRLNELGLVVSQSKWMNTVVVKVTPQIKKEMLSGLSFIDSVRWLGKFSMALSNEPETAICRARKGKTIPGTVANIRSESREQLTLLNGEKLHNAGFRGDGVQIAIIDAGFPSWDSLSLIKAERVKEYMDFSYPQDSGYGREKHGTQVLSIMLADSDDSIKGTAPEATYYLYKTENMAYELPVEEDFWVEALERADRMGVDIVNSSLGYHAFDISALNHSKREISRSTAFISRAARKAIDKGMFLVISAGNDAMNEWGVIGFVSGVYVKPDVAAIGTGTVVLFPDGSCSTSNGTSFSTPTVAGLVACLWQACPGLSNRELLNVIRRSGSQYKTPDIYTGYGIPDFMKALRLAGELKK
ncbi:MAG: S8 family serine peptidase [Bacteroidales bacterium]